MANQVMLIVNPTATSFDNVNGAGQDIPAYSVGTAAAPGEPVTLTDAEQAAFAAAHPSALIQLCADTTPTAAEREVHRLAAKILKLGKNPGKVTS